jgi:hypothetical protein
VASTGQRTNAYRVLVEQPKRKIPLADLEVDWKMILNKSYGHRTNQINLVHGGGHVTGSCAHGNETSGSIKRVKFLNTRKTTGFSRKVLLYGVTNVIIIVIVVLVAVVKLDGTYIQYKNYTSYKNKTKTE